MNYAFDHKKMEELLGHFFNLTNARYCLYDTDNHILCSSGNQTPFCSLITGCKEENNRLCASDDLKNMTRASKMKIEEPYIYRCYCGIINVIFPLKINNDLFGYMMFGQMLDENDIDGQWKITDGLTAWAKSINRYKLKKAFYSLPRYSTEKIQSCAQILNACATYIRTEAITSQMSMDDESRLNSIIQQNYSLPLTLDSIASEMGISKSKLCSIAAKNGTTVISMVNDYRMKIASHMIGASSMKISEIATQVGVNDYNYFSKMFKKAYGMTPREYKAHYRMSKSVQHSAKPIKK